MQVIYSIQAHISYIYEGCFLLLYRQAEGFDQEITGVRENSQSTA